MTACPSLPLLGKPATNFPPDAVPREVLSVCLSTVNHSDFVLVLKIIRKITICGK